MFSLAVHVLSVFVCVFMCVGVCVCVCASLSVTVSCFGGLNAIGGWLEPNRKSKRIYKCKAGVNNNLYVIEGMKEWRNEPMKAGMMKGNE